MLINHHDKIILWTPFKNYSTSLGYATSRHPHWSMLVGEQPRGTWEKPQYNGHVCHCEYPYHKILPLRNPYERVVSQYHWRLKVDGPIEFDLWLHTEGRAPCLGPVTVRYPWDERVTLSDLKNMFSPFPHENRSPYPPVTLSPSQKELIYFLHYEDFEGMPWSPS